MTQILKARITPVPIDPSLTSAFVSQAGVQTYIATAMLTLVAYNAVTTIDKEVQYFWRRPISVVSVVFFLNRYAGLLGTACQIIGFNSKTTRYINYDWTGAMSDQITILLIDYILLVRVTALYSRNKKIGIFLWVIFALEAISFLTVTAVFITLQDITLGELATGKTLCGNNNIPSPILGSLLWTIPLTYGTILMVLALYRAAKLWNETEGFTGARLIHVLIQDQLLYFGMVIFCSVCNLVANATTVTTQLLNVIDAVGNPALLCVLGNHLLIHLKETAEKGLNIGTSYRGKTLTTMDFGGQLPPSLDDTEDSSV